MPEPFPTYVAGFKQWLSLGRSVVKGQAGYQILSPRTARFASATPAAGASWRRLAASSDGFADVRLPSAILAGTCGTVVLGRTSGTLAIVVAQR